MRMTIKEKEGRQHTTKSREKKSGEIMMKKDENPGNKERHSETKTEKK